MPEETIPASMQRWRLAHGQLLRYRQWGDECVLFNDITGDTHLLDVCALDLLLLLQQTGLASVDSLTDSVASTMRKTGRGDSDIVLCDLLDNLEEACLVERGQG